jgi:hypothetical protein
MKITPCPICNKFPKILQCVPFKDGTQRRMCKCPSYDSVIPQPNSFPQPWFVFIGDGDNNAIYKEWNKAVKSYSENPDAIHAKWTDNPQVELW